MQELKQCYVTDEQNRRIAVQLDIETFERLEVIIEDYGLARLMEEHDDEDETLGLSEAKAYYESLEKVP